MSSKLDNKSLQKKILEAFKEGATDEQACALVGISSDSLYRYCKKNEEFANQKKLAKQNLIVIAKEVIKKALKSGNVRVAQWYLERVCSDEFSIKTQVQNLEPVRVFVSESDIAEADKIIDEGLLC